MNDTSQEYTKQEQRHQKKGPVELRHHDSFRTWYVLKARMRKRSGLALRRTDMKRAGFFAAMMIMLAIIFGVFTGMSLEHFVINPPVQYIGICSPPAEITHGGCFIVQCTGSGSSESCDYIPAGTVEAQTTKSGSG